MDEVDEELEKIKVNGMCRESALDQGQDTIMIKHFVHKHLMTNNYIFVYLKLLVQKLDAMHKKHLLPGFDDRIQEERDIERLTDEITQVRTNFSL